MKIERGSICWYEFAGAYTNEQAGVRPCVVISNNSANEFSPVVTVVPLTTAHKKRLPIHTEIWLNGVRNTVLCEQIWTIAKDRIVNFAGKCTEAEMKRINKCLKIQLFMGDKDTPDSPRNCPHCFGQAEINTQYIGCGECYKEVVCKECGCRTKRVVFSGSEEKGAERKVLELWNRQI